MLVAGGFGGGVPGGDVKPAIRNGVKKAAMRAGEASLPLCSI